MLSSVRPTSKRPAPFARFAPAIVSFCRVSLRVWLGIVRALRRRLGSYQANAAIFRTAARYRLARLWLSSSIRFSLSLHLHVSARAVCPPTEWAWRSSAARQILACPVLQREYAAHDISLSCSCEYNDSTYTCVYYRFSVVLRVAIERWRALGIHQIVGIDSRLVACRME